MTKELIQSLVVFIDVSAILALAVLTDRYILWDHEWFGSFAGAAALAALPFTAFMGLRGAYRFDRLSNPDAQIRQILIAWFATFGFLAVTAFMMKVSSTFSRVGIAFFFSSGALMLLAVHYRAARWLRARLAGSKLSVLRSLAVMIGDAQALDDMQRGLAREGIEIVASELIDATTTTFADDCSAAAAALKLALSRTRASSILVFVPWQKQAWLHTLLGALDPLPAPVMLVADAPINALIEQRHVRYGRLNGFEVQRAPLSRLDCALKRAIDLGVASAALVLLAPLMLMTAAAIWIETGRPVFFRQRRRGFGGRVFEMVKFRSMTVMQDGPDVPQASRNDPRVTSLGRLLRKTSIDELPQLFNVIRGDMSIVGPRPHALAHDDQYTEIIAAYAYRHHVKPGITGWAQVNGARGETRQTADMERRVAYDLWYIRHWSIWLDIQIILRTAVSVLADSRAY
ncbi:MAG: exopolysaccharide biosynthesis polyprenyl glycosylphosphotransferase [Ancalomicrobiaceae bacterium]|nr:exopolysaccharide biosynthesis polyprenyl glycosylphosphotransferase [Ancalomicrobiaceae bacterium]